MLVALRFQEIAGSFESSLATPFNKAAGEQKSDRIISAEYEEHYMGHNMKPTHTNIFTCQMCATCPS